MMKKVYTKPTIREIQWDLSSAVCQSVIANSGVGGTCIRVETEGSAHSLFETRDNEPGDWHWVGSRP